MKDYTEQFNAIRDIPYSIPLSDEEDNNACVGKNQRLFEIFEADGVPVRWRICSFTWSSLGVPEKVLEHSTKDEATHAYLEIEHDGGWIVVDATWDKGLASVLPINEWSDVPNMKIAVPEIEIFSVEKSAEIMARVANGSLKRAADKFGDFYRALNAWLEEAREN